jgi:polysaccharide biosynthesis protein PslH
VDGEARAGEPLVSVPPPLQLACSARTVRVRILVVSSHFPFPPRSGAETRIYHLVRGLARRHEVTLLSVSEPDDEAGIEQLRSECDVEVVPRRQKSPRRGRVAQAASLTSSRPHHAQALQTPEMQAAIDRLCRRPFSAVQLETSFLFGLRFPSETAVVLDEHNIEYELFERMGASDRSLPRRLFYRSQQQRCRSFEERSWRHASGCVLTSERDEAIVKAAAPETPTAVVPNGVDPDAFRPGTTEPESGPILFNGVLDYRPNLDAAVYLVDNILPLVRSLYPEARLTIVGRGHAADRDRLQRPGVTVTGEVPDVRPFLARAAVVVVPVRSGGGTRLKVVEGLAMAKPMVSTSIGCEGIDVVHDRHLLISDTAETFAASVVSLLNDPARGRALGEAGRTLVERYYSWERGVEILETFYERVLAAGAYPESPMRQAAVDN